MSQPHDPVPETNRSLSDDAARWFMRLQEPAASSQTFREWQQWLNAAPEHQRVYEEIEGTVLCLSRVPTKPKLPSADEMARDTYDGSQSIAEWRAGTEQSRKRSRWQRYAIAAGVAFVAVGSAWLWTRDADVSQSHDYSYKTAAGERQKVELPDGSRITLDADSALAVRLTADRRSLTLQHGEAYFEVAKDPQRPFVVHAGAAQVTAVGTAFNVRMTDDRTVVAVTEGKVEFLATPALAAPTTLSSPSTQIAHTRPRLAAQVAAGEAVSYLDDGNLQALPTHEAPLATTWLDGRRQYRNEPLRYVLADLDRYTGRRIELGDARVGELQFTGTLNLQNSDAWLRGLSVALPVTVTERADGTVTMQLVERQ